MNYLLKSNKKNKIKKPLIIISVIVVVIVLLRFITPNFLPNSFHFIARPLWKVEDFVSFKFGHLVSYFQSKKILTDENNNLREQISRMNIQLLSNAVLVKENKDLKEAVGRIFSKNQVAAFVLTRPPQSPYDTFTLDVGADFQIKKGDNVVVGDSLWIGKITEVYSNTSIATLLSSSNHPLNLVIARTGLPITVYGQGGGNFEAQVPRGVVVLEGDILVPPGLNNLLVAVVSSVEINPEDSFQKIFGKIPQNINTIKTVDIDRGNYLEIDSKILKAEDKTSSSTNSLKR